MPIATAANAPTLFIVFNLGSGRGDADAARATIESGCAAAGRGVRIFAVDQPQRLPALVTDAVAAAQAVGGIVVAAGGDGTINAVAQVAHRAGCAFGVLPHGTFNYFSRTHGIPAPTEESLQMLLAGTPQPVQVGLVNDRLFLVNASLGLYVRLLQERETFKAQLGRSRLVAMASALVTLLRGYRMLDLRIVFRGEERAIRTPTLFVGNNALQFQQVGMAEAQALEQGELGAVALQPLGRLAMLKLALRGAFGRLGDADEVCSFSFKSLQVKPARGKPGRRVRVATDGEVGWLQMPLTFRVAPEPLWLVKPAAADTTAP